MGSAVDHAPRLRQIRSALEGLQRAQFDRLAKIAARQLGAPVGLISMVDTERHHFAGVAAKDFPFDDERSMPLSHSFCKHVVERAEPLVIEDAREDALVSGSPAIRDLGVLAYVGVPLVGNHGNVLGSVCAIEPTPRRWTQEDVEQLEDVAELASCELKLLAAVSEAGVGLQALQGALDDVTVTAEQRRRDEQKLAATIGHEVRTPLLAIRNLVEDLRDGLGETEEDLGRIDSCAHEALRIIEDQVAVARRSTADTVRIQDVHVATLLQGLRAMLRPLTPPGVDLVVDTTSIGDEVLRTDPVKLGQVLRNLLTNAVRHTSQGEVSLSFGLRGSTALFTVTDTGVGIPAADQERIFASGEQSGTHAGAGGLGLSLARRLARLLGGDVTVRSQLGQGATFTVAIAARLDG